jgi:hypothetical protein
LYRWTHGRRGIVGIFVVTDSSIAIIGLGEVLGSAIEAAERIRGRGLRSFLDLAESLVLQPRLEKN